MGVRVRVGGVRRANLIISSPLAVLLSSKLEIYFESLQTGSGC